MSDAVATVHLGLGSNLGDRAANIRGAVEHIGGHPAIRTVRLSALYETEPLGPPQPHYLNAAVEGSV